MKKKLLTTSAFLITGIAVFGLFSFALAKPVVVLSQNYGRGISSADVRLTSSSASSAFGARLVLERSRKLLERSIRLLMTRNSQLENRIKNNPGIYGDFVQNILGELESDSQELNGYLASAQSAPSSDALSFIAKSVSSYKSQQSSDLRKLVVLAHIAQYEKSVLATALKRSSLVGKKIDSLKSQGKDTSSLESLLSQADSQLSGAQQAIDSVKKSVADESIDIIILSDIQQKLASAQNTVKDAYRLFTQIAVLGSQLMSKNSSSAATSSGR